MIFWVKITQLPMTYLIYLLIFFMLSRILCMIVPISKIGCSLSGMFQNLTLPWTILSIVASYRELCQHFLILALRNTWVSTIPWYYAEILISLIPSIARKKTYTRTHGMVLLATSNPQLWFQSAGQMSSLFLSVPSCEKWRGTEL